MNEKLGAGLHYALCLMRKRIELGNKQANIRSQYLRPSVLTKPLKKIFIAIIAIVIMILLSAPFKYSIAVVYHHMSPQSKEYAEAVLANPDDENARYWEAMANDPYGNNTAFFLANITLFAIAIPCALVVWKIANMTIASKNAKITEQNTKVNERNQALMKNETEIIQQIKSVQEQYAKEILPWYPGNYCYIDAAEFFLYSVQNHRADTLKEAINLYEDELHKGRMERAQQQMLENQEAMIKYQKMGNMLQAGSIAMQAGIHSAIGKNTAAVDNNTEAINRLGNR